MAYTTIDDPTAYFGTTLWAGNNATPRTLSFTGNSNLQPDWMWTKKTDGADHNQVFDSVRGFGVLKIYVLDKLLHKVRLLMEHLLMVL